MDFSAVTCFKKRVAEQKPPLQHGFQSKQVELQFWLAETLVNAALGCKAPIARNMWMQTEEAYVVSGTLL